MIGVVLAGGLGSRMGEVGQSKPAVPLAGRPMIGWPLAALAPISSRLAVTCKADTTLPPLPRGVRRWNEPAEPRHPLTGIVFSLREAGEEVLICAADMPFVEPDALRALLAAAEGSPRALAVIAQAGGRSEPLLGIYRPDALPRLAQAAKGERLRGAVAALEPVAVSVGPGAVRSVNTPVQLDAACAELAERDVSDAAAGRSEPG